MPFSAPLVSLAEKFEGEPMSCVKGIADSGDIRDALGGWILEAEDEAVLANFATHTT